MINQRIKLNKTETLNKLKELTNKLSEQTNIDYKLNTNMDHFIAKSYYNKDRKVNHIEIGIKEIYNKPTTFMHPINPPIDDCELAFGVLNVYHETMHYIQHNIVFQKPELNDNEQNQLIQELACITNDEYYGNGGNYAHNANEIQAEHYGIQKPYEYLRDTFPKMPKDYHENLIISVVNQKMHRPKNQYFVYQEKPFQSLEEINKAFNEAYENSFITKREFDILNDINNDDIKLFMRKHPEAYDAYVEAYLDNKPLEQDKCIACIGLLLYPELRNLYPAMKNMDLSYDTVILKKPKINQQRIAAAEAIAPDMNDTNFDTEYNL